MTVKIRLQFTCMNSNNACSFVKRFTSKENGFLVLDRNDFDDFDHEAIKEYPTLESAKKETQEIIERSRGSWVDVKVLEV